MKTYRSMVLVTAGPSSIQHGAQQLYQRLKEEINAFNLTNEIFLTMVNDLVQTDALPMVIVYPEAVTYGPVAPDQAHYLVKEQLSRGKIAQDLLAPKKVTSGPMLWLKARQGTLPAEKRIVLERAGIIDPEDIDDYIICNGYEALAKMFRDMTPQDVINEISNSGLRGRGGAGFPVGRKMSFVASENGSQKYVICNADESEPGTFKDRLILEGDPHSIVESMIISAYAVGATEGFIYIRGEYPIAYNRLEKAIHQAHDYGLLGKNIFNSGFDFELHVHAGAGAYICGEETALIESIEGKRGEPRARPPYPPTYGLWGKPTLVNNVETLANVPPILRNGAEWYRKIGTSSSPGTKVYMILGNVNSTGVVEVPMGITIREIINIYGKGMKNNATLKLIQTGGSSGSIIPASLQDTPMDFDAFKRAGASLGSGALLICDESNCVVDLARVLMQFFRFESCGKCTPCRIGTQRSYEILTRITEGNAEIGELDELLRLGHAMDMLSNCGLGQTAGVPIRDILKHFRAEVEAHIKLGVCPVGICPMVPAIEEAPAIA